MRKQQLERSCLGPRNVDAANNKIGAFLSAAVHTMVPITFTEEDVTNWAFSKEVLDLCRLAHTIVSSNDGPINLAMGYGLSFTLGGWKERNMARPLPDRANKFNPTNIPPAIAQFITDVDIIRRDYAIVRKVVWWLDAHATLGAVRYYFPPMGVLIPSLPAEATVSHREPAGISALLPLIRRASTTVAASLMLPEVKPRNHERSNLAASFEPSQFVLTEGDGKVIVPGFSMWV